MNALNIALKDIQIFLRDRSAVINLFLLPMVFILVLSTAMQGFMGGDGDSLITLPVVNLDPDGEAAQALIDALNEAGGIEVKLYDQAQAQALLEDLEIERVLTIPTDFTADIAANRPVTLRLVSHADADVKETEAVRLVIDGAASDMALQIQILAALQQMGEMQAGAPESAEAFGVERLQAQARSQFKRAQSEPLVSVTQREPAQEVEQEEQTSASDIAVPGLTVLFVFMAAQTTARSVYDEKRVGSFRRLLAAPMSRTALLGGKILPNLVTGLIQSAVIFAFGIFGLRLLGLTPATLGNEPLATVLVVVLVVLCSSAMGILIAALARTEGQIGGLSVLLMWGMGLLGGCLIPLFILERFLGPIPMIVPHYWANRALVDLMVRGRGLADVTVEIAALLGFTTLFFVVGLWRFEFD